MITLYTKSADQYVSFDSFIVMRRCKNIRTQSGDNIDRKWGLFHNGTLYDWDTYRHDLAERNIIKLSWETLKEKQDQIWSNIYHESNQQNQSRPSTSP